MTRHELAIRSLATMARALGRSEPLLRLLELAADEARDALKAASVSVSRVEPGGAAVRTLINAGDLGPDEARWPTDEVYVTDQYGNLGRVVGELLTWTTYVDDPNCDNYERDLLRSLGKGSALGAPIVVDGTLWGELYATRHLGQEPFAASDSAYVEVLSAILGGAISRALREESLEHLASHDVMTDLVNRRALDVAANRVFDVPPDESRTVTVVALDINGLKHVNDQLGHHVGDQFIQSVAQSLRSAFTGIPGSLVARVGGDEFTVLIEGQCAGKVVQIMDGLCVRHWPFVDGAGVSAGAATVVLDADSTLTPAELFAAADRAQYVAKRGRLAATVVSTEFDC